MATKDTLTPKQLAAIAALLSPQYRSIEAVAVAVGIGERTLFRWLDDPQFAAALERAQRETIGAAVRQLTALAGYGVTTIAKIMADTDAPAGVRLRAAIAVLDAMLKLREHADFEERLVRLEAAHSTD